MKARILSALFLMQFAVLFGVLLGYNLWAACIPESGVPFLMIPVVFLAFVAFVCTIEDES